MIRVSFEAIESAAQDMGRVAGDLGCGTSLTEIAGAADETAAAGALDAVASAWERTFQQHSEQCLEVQAALRAAGECYFIAEQSIQDSLRTGPRPRPGGA
jgi:hypothetical protein